MPTTAVLLVCHKCSDPFRIFKVPFPDLLLRILIHALLLESVAAGAQISFCSSPNPLLIESATAFTGVRIHFRSSLKLLSLESDPLSTSAQVTSFFVGA